MNTPGYLTAALPGTGGRIKHSPEDFQVEEIPAYLPCGSGGHLYLRLQKVGMSTLELVHQLSRTFKLREGDIGYAGLKDARATTIQTISLPGVTPQQAATLQIPGVRLLDATLHGNKLRLGHLLGNRFLIRIREVNPGAAEQALETLGVLEDLGVPNFFGEQRYGLLGNNSQVGHALLQRRHDEAIRLIIGDPELIEHQHWREAAELYRDRQYQAAARVLPERMRDEGRMLQALADTGEAARAVFTLPRKRLRLYLSAFQSELFDRLVAMRLQSLETLWLGDLAWKHSNGACFVVNDPAIEQPRADAFEISPTAPLFGCKVQLAGGQSGILEESLLDKYRLKLSSFKLGQGITMPGERRPLRVPLQEVVVTALQGDLQLGFCLPRGSYATSVLREVIKGEPAESAG